MPKSTFIIAALVFLATPVLAEEQIALVGGQIVDGNGGIPLYDGVLLIEGERIVAIGPETEVTVPDDAKIVDTNGMTVMPGLIDIHVHFDILGHSDYNKWFGTYEKRMRTDIMPASAQAMLNAGVTTVRDLGADVDNIFWLREQVNSGAIPGPRTFIAGPFLRKSATAFVSDDYVDAWVVDNPEDARQKVRRLSAMGVDVIKTQDEALSQDELAAIYDESHRLGLRVASHIYSAEGIRTALKAGISNYDSIEHIGEYAETAYDDDIVRMIVDQNVVMAPTIIARDGLRQIIENPELTDDPRWKRDLPDDLYKEIRQSYRQSDLSKHPLYDKAVSDRIGREAKLRQLASAGAIFAISTDSGTRANPHHDAMWKEMVLVQRETGLSNMDVIVAATRTNSIVIQRQAVLGTLEAGKFADIIVVDGNPLEFLPDLRRIKHIIKGGEVIR